MTKEDIKTATYEMTVGRFNLPAFTAKLGILFEEDILARSDVKVADGPFTTKVQIKNCPRWAARRLVS